MNTWEAGTFRKMKIGELFCENHFPTLKLKSVLEELESKGCVEHLEKDIWKKIKNPPEDLKQRPPLPRKGSNISMPGKNIKKKLLIQRFKN